MLYLSAAWAAVTLALLIGVIRLSYRIEARSRPRPAVPVYTNFIATALNIGVARDRQTQALRRRMLGLWLVIALGFAAFAIAIETLGLPTEHA